MIYLPKCDVNNTFAPLLIRYSMVGIDPLIRVSSVISAPFRGTFKSHRTKTLFPLSSSSDKSLTDFLGVGAGRGGTTTGGHIPGLSAARLAAVSLMATFGQVNC